MKNMRKVFKVMLGVVAVAVTLLTGTKEVKAAPDYFYVELAEGTAATVEAPDLSDKYEYTFDLSGTWKPVTGSTLLSTASNSTKVYFRATGNYPTIPGGNSFKTESGSVRIGGDILTLLNKNPSQAQMGSAAFQHLFEYCTGIVDASQLKLPNNVTSECYQQMFR